MTLVRLQRRDRVRARQRPAGERARAGRVGRMEVARPGLDDREASEVVQAEDHRRRSRRPRDRSGRARARGDRAEALVDRRGSSSAMNVSQFRPAPQFRYSASVSPARAPCGTTRIAGADRVERRRARRCSPIGRRGRRQAVQEVDDRIARRRPRSPQAGRRARAPSVQSHRVEAHRERGSRRRCSGRCRAARAT